MARAAALTIADSPTLQTRPTRATSGMITSETAVAGVQVTLNQPIALRISGPCRPPAT